MIQQQIIPPEPKPDLSRLPSFGRRALGKIILQIIWGEALSEEVSRHLSGSADPMLARHTARQAQEERTHRLFFEQFYSWLAGRERITVPAQAVSRSLHRFGEELLDFARAGQTAEALWGLSVYLEGLASVFFQKAFHDCKRHWPAVEGVLGRVIREEERHVRFGRDYLRQKLESVSEEKRRTLAALGDRWGTLIERSIREANRQVFPFPLPVRALQAEFRTVVRESREAIGV